MKKLFNLRDAILFIGALFILAAFFLSFAESIRFSSGSGWYQESYHIIWGCDKMDVNGSIVIAEGDERFGPSIVPFIGIWMLLAGALGAIAVALFVKKLWAKWVVVGLAVLAIAGAVMQFFIFDAFCRAYVHKVAEMDHWSKQEEMKELEHFKNQYGNFDRKTVVSTLMGVFGIVGGLAIGVSRFLPEK